VLELAVRQVELAHLVVAHLVRVRVRARVRVRVRVGDLRRRGQRGEA